MATCRHFLLLLLLLLATGAGLRTAWGQADSPAASSPSSSASSSSSAKRARKPAADSALDAGMVKDNIYRNPAFGFSCKIPVGWVMRTEEMNEKEGGGDAQDKPQPQNSKEERRVLLAAFLRPPDARGEDVNASIVIAAESVATYPGLKIAAQYFGPLTEVVKAQGFKVVEEPYEFPVDARILARSDFQKNVGTKTMQQATLVMLAKGFVISFTFIAGSEDDVNELVEGLGFVPGR